MPDYGGILRMKHNAGFTLIELMLALALGLLVSAAAILMLMTGQKSYSMQQGLANLQDNANFGLNYITKDIRLANLNTQKSVINDETAYGGIVLTSSENATMDVKDEISTPLSNLYQTITGATASVNLLSRSHGAAEQGSAPEWTGKSNVKDASSSTDVLSDQLVIQYLPQYQLDDKGTANQNDDELIGGFDCEGNSLNFPLLKQDEGDFGEQVVVQRYFLRTSNKQSNEPNDALALACDAGYYSKSGEPTAINNYGDAGEVIMSRVDHFHFLLSIQHHDNTRQYISVDEYMKLASPRPRIVAVQLGILARSLDTVGREQMIKNDQNFKVLDQNVVIKTDPEVTTKYIRRVITQNVALRNAIGERGK